MSGKKLYTKEDLDNYVAAAEREICDTLVKQREHIDELRAEIAALRKKNEELESQKTLVYKAITEALKKAEDIERIALIRYNQELAQLKSFHRKWVGYFDKIIERYPLDDDLSATAAVNRKIGETLEKAGDLDAQYQEEVERLKNSDVAATDDYSDRSAAGFSFEEALHPKDDLMDIMKELGVIMDDEEE